MANHESSSESSDVSSEEDDDDVLRGLHVKALQRNVRRILTIYRRK
mgnify:CR=1 FL=1